LSHQFYETVYIATVMCMYITHCVFVCVLYSVLRAVSI